MEMNTGGHQRRPSFAVESNPFRLGQYRDADRLGRACGIHLEEVADGEWILRAAGRPRKKRNDELAVKRALFFQTLAAEVKSVVVVSIVDRRGEVAETGVEWFVIRGGRVYCVNGDQISSWLLVLARVAIQDNPCPDILTELGEWYPLERLERSGQ
jgi:hypothetical protein